MIYSPRISAGTSVNDHTHANKAVIDQILTAGSGNIITQLERDKLDQLTADYKGAHPTGLALSTAYPTASAGNYATVSATNTIWIWDAGNVEWVDSGTQGVTIAIIDSLLSTSTVSALSANQGKILKDLIDALTAVVSGKANASHTHAISEIVNLQTALDSKAALSHNHPISEISGLNTALLGKQDTSEKNAANGYAGLGSDSKLAAGQIPTAFSVNTIYEKYQEITVGTATVPAINVLDGGTVYMQIDHTGTVSTNSVLTTAFTNLVANHETRLTIWVSGNAQNITFPDGTLQLSADGLEYTTNVLVKRTKTTLQKINVEIKGTSQIKVTSQEF